MASISLSHPRRRGQLALTAVLVVAAVLLTQVWAFAAPGTEGGGIEGDPALMARLREVWELGRCKPGAEELVAALHAKVNPGAAKVYNPSPRRAAEAVAADERSVAGQLDAVMRDLTARRTDLEARIKAEGDETVRAALQATRDILVARWAHAVKLKGELDARHIVSKQDALGLLLDRFNGPADGMTAEQRVAAQIRLTTNLFLEGLEEGSEDKQLSRIRLLFQQQMLFPFRLGENGELILEGPVEIPPPGTPVDVEGAIARLLGYLGNDDDTREVIEPYLRDLARRHDFQIEQLEDGKLGLRMREKQAQAPAERPARLDRSRHAAPAGYGTQQDLNQLKRELRALFDGLGWGNRNQLYNDGGRRAFWAEAEAKPATVPPVQGALGPDEIEALNAAVRKPPTGPGGSIADTTERRNLQNAVWDAGLVMGDARRRLDDPRPGDDIDRLTAGYQEARKAYAVAYNRLALHDDPSGASTIPVELPVPVERAEAPLPAASASVTPVTPPARPATPPAGLTRADLAAAYRRAAGDTEGFRKSFGWDGPARPEDQEHLADLERKEQAALDALTAADQAAEQGAGEGRPRQTGSASLVPADGEQQDGTVTVEQPPFGFQMAKPLAGAIAATEAVQGTRDVPDWVSPLQTWQSAIEQKAKMTAGESITPGPSIQTREDSGSGTLVIRPSNPGATPSIQLPVDLSLGPVTMTGGQMGATGTTPNLKDLLKLP